MIGSSRAKDSRYGRCAASPRHLATPATCGEELEGVGGETCAKTARRGRRKEGMHHESLKPSTYGIIGQEKMCPGGGVCITPTHTPHIPRTWTQARASQTSHSASSRRHQAGNTSPYPLLPPSIIIIILNHPLFVLPCSRSSPPTPAAPRHSSLPQLGHHEQPRSGAGRGGLVPLRQPGVDSLVLRGRCAESLSTSGPSDAPGSELG